MDNPFDDEKGEPIPPEVWRYGETIGQFLYVKHLLMGFQKYWRENRELILDRTQDLVTKGLVMSRYPLTVLNFLENTLNKRTKISRKYGMGRGGFDLILTDGDIETLVRVVIKENEISREDSFRRFTRFLESRWQKFGFMVIFELDPQKPLEEKIFAELVKFESFYLDLVGC
ncbi:MAG: hypothetical protein LBF38_04205 [Deltaproteobacteria bacterium]|jgi:hypothetical protein|nr:hypothetical protein [Deltaproteobacteria bacterium]